MRRLRAADQIIHPLNPGAYSASGMLLLVHWVKLALSPAQLMRLAVLLVGRTAGWGFMSSEYILDKWTLAVGTLIMYFSQCVSVTVNHTASDHMTEPPTDPHCVGC